MIAFIEVRKIDIYNRVIYEDESLTFLVIPLYLNNTMEKGGKREEIRSWVICLIYWGAIWLSLKKEAVFPQLSTLIGIQSKAFRR